MDIVIKARRVQSGVYEYKLGAAVFEIKRVGAGVWELAEYIPFHPGRVLLGLFDTKKGAHETLMEIAGGMFFNA